MSPLRKQLDNHTYVCTMRPTDKKANGPGKLDPGIEVQFSGGRSAALAGHDKGTVALNQERRRSGLKKRTGVHHAWSAGVVARRARRRFHGDRETPKGRRGCLVRLPSSATATATAISSDREREKRVHSTQKTAPQDIRSSEMTSPGKRLALEDPHSDRQEGSPTKGAEK